MRIWNVGEKEIAQQYNSKLYIIKPNQVIDVSDDLGVWFLSKRHLRGQGLVQLKDGDNKGDRYSEAMDNMMKWNTEKWTDYERHCEERESQSLKPLAPHKEILTYKEFIDKYNKWEQDGRPIPKEISVVSDDKMKVYVCPHCSKEFDVKVAYFGHLRSHQKGEDVVESVVTNKGEGKG